MSSKHFDFEKFSLDMRMKQAAYRHTVTSAAAEIGVSTATLSRINREVGLPDLNSFFACVKWLDKNPTFYMVNGTFKLAVANDKQGEFFSDNIAKKQS